MNNKLLLPVFFPNCSKLISENSPEYKIIFFFLPLNYPIFPSPPLRSPPHPLNSTFSAYIIISSSRRRLTAEHFYFIGFCVHTSQRVFMCVVRRPPRVYFRHIISHRGKDAYIIYSGAAQHPVTWQVYSLINPTLFKERTATHPCIRNCDQDS